MFGAVTVVLRITANSKIIDTVVVDTRGVDMEDKIHYNEMMNAVYTKFMIHGACPGALAVAVVAILQYGMLEKEKNATMAHTTNTLQTIIHRTKISTSTIECLIQVRTRRHGALVGVTWSEEYMRFPPGFKFGAATASYQVEGAWNASDKGENIWDRFTHTRPDIITDGATGDVACDSYHLWRRDIEMATELGLHFYRLSLSWSRLLPSGFSNYVSEDGVRFYNDLIDGLLEKGIEPLVTIYHWDLPQPFQDLGGWTNPLIVDWFADYARVVFTLFGDRVKIWLTFNEPIIFCDMAYNSGLYAPGILDTELSPYLCNKNVMMAHAKAWRMYDEEFRWKYHGEVSLANHITWMSPWGEEDEELAELARENYGGRYSHPIFSKEGGWPPTIEKLMIENSRKRGYSRSVFPPFTQEEKEYVRGTFDFYGLNHYTSRLIRKARKDEPIGFWPVSGAPDLEAILERHPSWPVSPSFWFYINPEGIRRQLVWLKEKYGDIKFLITENGLATRSDLDDQNRVQFYKDYMREILLAINKDGINVTHYTAWTLMDNFEWADGYTVKFGLYEVDFSHPNRTRTPRASAAFYADVIRRHGLRISNDEH